MRELLAAFVPVWSERGVWSRRRSDRGRCLIRYVSVGDGPIRRGEEGCEVWRGKLVRLARGDQGEPRRLGPMGRSTAEEIAQMIQRLEFENLRPLTDAFAELALASASWSMTFSSALPQWRVSGLSVDQTEWTCHPDKKKVISIVCYRTASMDGEMEKTGRLEIESRYAWVGPGRMELHVVGHRLIPSPGKQNVPDDPACLVEKLQRCIPQEVFDPDGTLIDLTYLDTSLCIVRFMSDRYRGVRNVFSRMEV